jgi:hypothetical protein
MNSTEPITQKLVRELLDYNAELFFGFHTNHGVLR